MKRKRRFLKNEVMASMEDEKSKNMHSYPNEIKNIIREANKVQLASKIKQLTVLADSTKKKLSTVTYDPDGFNRLKSELEYLKNSIRKCEGLINDDDFLENINNIVWSISPQGHKFWLNLCIGNLNIVWNSYDYGETTGTLLYRKYLDFKDFIIPAE